VDFTVGVADWGRSSEFPELRGSAAGLIRSTATRFRCTATDLVLLETDPLLRALNPVLQMLNPVLRAMNLVLRRLIQLYRRPISVLQRLIRPQTGPIRPHRRRFFLFRRPISGGGEQFLIRRNSFALHRDLLTVRDGEISVGEPSSFLI
jgi:hypothetical protein